jgi:hypothetical protein
MTHKHAYLMNGRMSNIGGTVGEELWVSMRTDKASAKMDTVR